MIDSGRQILLSATLHGSSAGHAGTCRRSIQPPLACELRLETFRDTARNPRGFPAEKATGDNHSDCVLLTGLESVGP